MSNILQELKDKEILDIEIKSNHFALIFEEDFFVVENLQILNTTGNLFKLPGSKIIKVSDTFQCISNSDDSLVKSSYSMMIQTVNNIVHIKWVNISEEKLDVILQIKAFK